jgi:release factor glutamine methyltransferase
VTGKPQSQSRIGSDKSSPVAARTEAWTTRKLLKWMTDHFASKEVDSPRVVAEMLLSHVLDCERMRLYMEADRPASAVELATLRSLVQRAANHEPAQYLVGQAWFFGKQFAVDRRTLIPRPSTETLVELVIRWLRLSPGLASSPLIADVGTGTGCIAISLAAAFPGARVVATDVAPEALHLAEANAKTHAVAERIEFQQGSLLAPLRNRMPGAKFGVLASNPPYISDYEWDAVARNVKEHEPASALRGGPDGLDFIRPLIAEAPAVLSPGGLLVIEIADGQRDAVIELAQRTGELANIDVLKDHEGLWRVLTAELA